MIDGNPAAAGSIPGRVLVVAKIGHVTIYVGSGWAVAAPVPGTSSGCSTTA